MERPEKGGGSSGDTVNAKHLEDVEGGAPSSTPYLYLSMLCIDYYGIVQQHQTRDPKRTVDERSPAFWGEQMPRDRFIHHFSGWFRQASGSVSAGASSLPIVTATGSCGVALADGNKSGQVQLAMV